MNVPPQSCLDKSDVVKFSRDVITVIRDPRSPLGKRFTLNADGTVSKGTVVEVAEGVATMHHVPDEGALVRLLEQVANDSHAAIIPSVFNGIEIGEEFVVMSERLIAKRLRLSGREATKGVHQIEIDGVMRKTVGRLKENIVASTWQLLDRDNDQHTPPEHAADDFHAWLAKVDMLLPGVAGTDLLRAPSVSARVLKDGQPVGGGNGHTWVRFADPDDAERTRVAIPIRAAQLGLAWSKPRISKATGASIGKGNLVTVIDHSVFTPGRLVFVGKPVVGKGLEVAEPMFTVVPGMTDYTLDSSKAALPDSETIKAVTRAAGCELHVSTDGTRMRVDAFDLQMDTPLETQDGGVLTVREALAEGKPLRCQAPMRASVSFAGKFNLSPASGRPFVHDVGTGTNHWLNDEEWTEHHDAEVAAVFSVVELSPAEERESAAAAARNKAKWARNQPEVKVSLERDQVIDRGPNVVPYAEFTRAMEPPNYVWHRVLQKGCLYALTAKWGHGKTALMITVAMHVATGRGLGGHQIEQQKVLYLCGENPDDVKLRTTAAAMKFGIDPGELAQQICFTRRPFALDNEAELRGFVKEACAFGPFGLLVIDTGPAHSSAQEENDNREMHKLAMAMRDLMQPLGSPATVALMHPTKEATRDNLQPRGGGAFSGSIDGELCAWQEHGQVEFFHRTKFRGPGFDPIRFLLQRFELPGMRDNFGEPVMTVLAEESDGSNPLPIRRKPLTGAAAVAHQALEAALGDLAICRVMDASSAAEAAAALNCRPPSAAVHIDDWRAMAYAMGISDGDGEAKKKAFKRGRDKLGEEGCVKVWRDLCWLRVTDRTGA